MALVEVRDLVKSFGEGASAVEALKGVDLFVEQGEFICIMGASGSGKTTLLQLLGGLDQPTSGEVKIAGVKLSGIKEQQLALFRRKKIGFVFQSFNLIPVLTAEENVALPLLIDKQEYREGIRRALELLKTVGLENRSKHRPAELSGGQQQRVAIARALSNRPAILLADEPTGALDSVTSREIIHLLRKACDELGQTSIIVTHDPFVSAIAERVVVLVDGRVADDFKLEGNWLTRNLSEQVQRIQLLMQKHYVNQGVDE